MNLAAISSYHLLCELLKGGRADLYTDLEPIDMRQIVAVLRERTKKDYGEDVDNWIDWFLKSDALPPQDRTNLARLKRLRDMERNYIPQIDKERGQ